MNNTDAIVVGALFFGVVLFSLLFLPQVIAKSRGGELKQKPEFGGTSEDLVLAIILFPFRIRDALSAKPKEQCLNDTTAERDK